MSEKIGETVRDGADYRCARCHQMLRMSRGTLIQPCPHCGYDTYESPIPALSAGMEVLARMNRAERQSSLDMAEARR